MPWKIPLSSLEFGPAHEAAALRVLRSGWLSMGEETLSFEAEFAAFLGVKHAVACSSGTAALHLALLALGIGPGTAVIQPAVNFVAAANMTLACGAEPVFADICALDEPTVSPECIEAALANTARSGARRPAAVIVMHYAGFPCRIRDILEICAARHVPVIEDACHAPGARLSDASAASGAIGTLGDAGCFSFFSNKNLAVGEGGMLVTNRDDVAEAGRLLRSHGMTTLTWERHHGHAAAYDVTRHGYNYRIDELRSALGREQLRKLESANRRRRELTVAYWQALAPLEGRGWQLPFKADRRSGGLEYSACHLMTAVAPGPDLRRQTASRLREAGIQTSRHYPLVPGFSAFGSSIGREALRISAAYCERTLTLPLCEGLSDEQLKFVTQTMIGSTVGSADASPK